MFSVFILPLGIVIGFKATPLPFLLAHAGVSVDRIARVSAIVNLPGVLVFLWAPLVDTMLRRTTWLALATFATALSVCLYLPLVGASHLDLLTGLILMGGIADSLILASCGGLIVAAIARAAQARASSFLQAGCLGGAALSGAAILWLVSRASVGMAGACVAAFIALLGFIPLVVDERAPGPTAGVARHFADIGRELGKLVKTPCRRWSAVLLLGPGATGAAMFLLPAIAGEYNVGGNGVAWINGLGGGALLALGCLTGTLFPGQWDRRLLYAFGAAMNGAAVTVLLTGRRPWFYAVGTALYLMTAGLCQVWSIALTAEIVGDARQASTLFAVLNALTTVALVYMIRVEGAAYHYLGSRGLFIADMAGNLLVCAAAIAVFLAFKKQNISVRAGATGRVAW
jgi:PAT family beta-lactamase induction signal transducer AmpG